jgi:hypothetical protein
VAYPVYEDNGGISAGTSSGTTPISFPATVAADDIIVAVVGDADNDSFLQPIGPGLNSWTSNKNHFPDSSFEVGRRLIWGSDTSSTVSQSTDYANSGSNSLKVVTTTNVYGGTVNFDVAADASTQYTVSCYIYNTGTVNLDIFLLDQDKNTIASKTNQSSTQDSWVRHEVTGSTAADDTGTRLKVRKSNDATATTFYIDDIQLEKAASATAYTDSASVWSKIGEFTSNDFYSSAAFWMRADGTEDSKTQNWLSVLDAGSVVGGIYFRFSGCVTTGTPYEDHTAAGVTSSTSATISEVTTSGSERLCCCFIGVEDDTGTSGGTNYAEAADVTTTTGSDLGFSLFTYQKATAGTVSSETATVGGTDYWTTYTLALKPVGGEVYSVVIQEASHTHSADNLDLINHVVLVVSESIHTHSADNLVLLFSAGTITVADATSSHTADNLTVLMSAGTITVSDATSAHAVENLVLVFHAVYVPVIPDVLHAHSADSMALTTSGGGAGDAGGIDGQAMRTALLLE